MLIDILRMPPVHGIPIDRSLTIYNNETPINDPKGRPWNDAPFYADRLHVGSRIDRAPTQLYKAIHIGHDHRYAFETVFSVEAHATVCLYCKLISPGHSQIGVSLYGIRWFWNQPQSILPLTHFVTDKKSHRWGNGHPSYQLLKMNPVDTIVPPVFEENFAFYVSSLLTKPGSGYIDPQLAWSYKPIYDYIPQVMEALVSGEFIRSPFTEIQQYHPMIQVQSPKWFQYEVLNQLQQNRQFETAINHPEFDGQVLQLMLMFPTEFSVQIGMGAAIEGIDCLGISNAHVNLYNNALIDGYQTSSERENLQQRAFASVLYECVMIYCRLFYIDYREFGKQNDMSTITVSKNIVDEITITFNDLLHDRYVSFYSSFPALALSTLAVGWSL